MDPVPTVTLHALSEEQIRALVRDGANAGIEAAQKHTVQSAGGPAISSGGCRILESTVEDIVKLAVGR